MQKHFTKGLVRGRVIPSADCEHRGVIILQDGSPVRCSILNKAKKAAADGIERVWKVFAVSQGQNLLLALTGVCNNPMDSQIGRILIRGTTFHITKHMYKIKIWSPIANKYFWTFVYGLPWMSNGSLCELVCTVDCGRLRVLESQKIE
jgi:hypothetical protein